MIDFDKAFDRLISSEGGFTADPADPGNWTTGRPGFGRLLGTNWGISAATYPALDIRALTREQAKAIYRRDWWENLAPDTIAPEVVFQLWDMAVNAGMGNAKRALQRALGVSDDGVIGPRTLQAYTAADVRDVIDRFNAQRLRFYTSRSGWPTFGKGWTNRVADRLDNAAADT